MKGQMAIEFFVYFTISILMLAVMYSSTADRQSQAFEYREVSELESIASKVAFELEKAEAYGEGYSKTLNLPRESYGEVYNLEITENFVIISSDGDRITSSVRYSGNDFSLNSDQGPFEVMNNGSIHFVSE